MTAFTDVLPTSQLSQIRAIADRLSEALADPEAAGPGRDLGLTGQRWRGQSLSKGATGIAILHSARARTGLSGWERVHRWLAYATREDISAGPGAGLWHGAPAVAFAVSTAAPLGQYRRALKRLDRAVVSLTQSRLTCAAARIAAGTRPSLGEFDLVRGLAGLGAYLLRRDPHSQIVRQVLAYLVRLTEPVPADDPAADTVPGWWTSDIPLDRSADVFAHGHADLGMAHGISGPLALLATAMRRGIVVDGQAAAIDRICHWLDGWRRDSPAGPWWPKRVTFTELRTGRPSRTAPGRPSWCYGTPGIARAMQLAGHATGDEARRRQAELALSGCVTDPHQLSQLTDLSLCHGWAGLITTLWCAAIDAPSSDLSARLPALLSAFTERITDDPTVQAPGLVDGSAGIALTLHTVATGRSHGWETSLLIN
jgi:hypothetical protein